MDIKNIVIIGSLSQAEVFDKLEQMYKLQGHNVIRPFRHFDKTFFNIEKEYLEKISEADEIIAIPKPDGTFGEATTFEILFALFYQEKNVTVYEYKDGIFIKRNLEEFLS